MANAEKNRTMIEGTEGHTDYLVIARSNGYILGIKALLALGDDGAMYGFRLRMQKADTSDSKVETLPSKEQEVMLKTFPEIPWGKRNMTRFSTVLTVPSSFGYEFRKQLLEEAVSKVEELITDMEGKIKPVMMINKQDCIDFLLEEYSRLVEETVAQLEGAKPKAASKSEGSVVEFPNSKDGVDIE